MGLFDRKSSSSSRTDIDIDQSQTDARITAGGAVLKGISGSTIQFGDPSATQTLGELAARSITTFGNATQAALEASAAAKAPPERNGLLVVAALLGVTGLVLFGGKR